MLRKQVDDSMVLEAGAEFGQMFEGVQEPADSFDGRTRWHHEIGRLMLAQDGYHMFVAFLFSGGRPRGMIELQPGDPQTKYAMRPPPRGPLRISGETPAATASNTAQQACRMVMPRASSASSMGPCSVEDGEKEMPQKSTEPVPTLSSTTTRGPAAANSCAIPARLATGRYRSR